MQSGGDRLAFLGASWLAASRLLGGEITVNHRADYFSFKSSSDFSYKDFSVTYCYLQLFCILLQSGYWCFMYPFTFQISLVFALFTSFRPALIFGIVDFGCSLDNSFDFQANL